MGHSHTDAEKANTQRLEHADSSSDIAKNEHGGDEMRGQSQSGGIGGGTISGKIAFVSLSMLWVGSQLPLYFLGGTLSYVSEDIGGKAATASSWMPVANTLALASVAPFSGYLTDIFGRRLITIIGGATIIVGIIVAATSHTFGQMIVGMALSGAGAGIGELTALSGVAELVPVKSRGLYLATVVMFLAPSTPYVLYSQLLSTRTEQGWRWGQWIALIYNGIALVGIVCTYFPEKNMPSGANRPSRKETLAKIDYIGGFLSIVGVTLFLVALQSGGYTHKWSSAYVLSTLIIGLIMMIAFCLWEWKGAKNPMIPRELFQGQKVVGVTFGIAFVAGMNFYSLINFFPLTFATMYNPDPIQIGIKGIGYGVSVTLGAVVFNMALTFFKKNNREVLLVATVIMTAFIGALAAATPSTPKLTVALGTIGGFGVGGILVPASSVALTACPDELIGTTVALSLSARVIGGSIGYAIYFNIFSNKLMAALPAYVAKAAGEAGLAPANIEKFVGTFLTTPKMAGSVPGATAEVLGAAAAAAANAYAHAFKYVWLTSVAFGCVAIVLCLCLQSNARFLTDRIAAHIKT